MTYDEYKIILNSGNKRKLFDAFITIAKSGDKELFLKVIDEIPLQDINEFLNKTSSVKGLYKENLTGFLAAVEYQDSEVVRILINRATPFVVNRALRDLHKCKTVDEGYPWNMWHEISGFTILMRHHSYDLLSHISNTFDPYSIAVQEFIMYHSEAHYVEGEHYDENTVTNLDWAMGRSYNILNAHEFNRWWKEEFNNMCKYVFSPIRTIHAEPELFLNFLHEQVEMLNKEIASFRMSAEIPGHILLSELNQKELKKDPTFKDLFDRAEKISKSLDKAISAVPQLYNNKIYNQLLAVKMELEFLKGNRAESCKLWAKVNNLEMVKPSAISLMSDLLYHMPQLFHPLTENQCKLRALCQNYYAANHGDKAAINFLNSHIGKGLKGDFILGTSENFNDNDYKLSLKIILKLVIKEFIKVISQLKKLPKEMQEDINNMGDLDLSDDKDVSLIAEVVSYIKKEIMKNPKISLSETAWVLLNDIDNSTKTLLSIDVKLSKEAIEVKESNMLEKKYDVENPEEIIQAFFRKYNNDLQEAIEDINSKAIKSSLSWLKASLGRFMKEDFSNATIVRINNIIDATEREINKLYESQNDTQPAIELLNKIKKEVPEKEIETIINLNQQKHLTSEYKAAK